MPPCHLASLIIDGLTPQQRKADYRARVEKAVREHADDATAQAALLKLLLEDGKTGEADAALKHALAAAPERADLYRQAIRFLSRQGKNEDAARLLQGAARAYPRDREILLLDAIALAVARQTADADHQLNYIQNRWPEWPAVWLARGMALGDRQALETAAALGARPAPEATLDWLLERPIGRWE